MWTRLGPVTTNTMATTASAPPAIRASAAELHPGEPNHRTTPSLCLEGRSTEDGRLLEVGENEVLQRHRLHTQRGIEDGAVRPHEKRALLVGMALLNDVLIYPREARSDPCAHRRDASATREGRSLLQ